MTVLVSAFALTAALRLLPAPVLVAVMADGAGMTPPQAACIVAAESGWDTWAVGALGERGLWQIHPTTWQFAREKMGADVDFALAFDAGENTRTAVWLIANGYGEWWSTWSQCQ